MEVKKQKLFDYFDLLSTDDYEEWTLDEKIEELEDIEEPIILYASLGDNKFEENYQLSLSLEEGNNGYIICLEITKSIVSFVGIEYNEETTYKRYFDSELAKKIYCYLDDRIMELFFENEEMNVDYGYSLLARRPKRNWGEFQIETITPDLVAAFEVLLNEYDIELDDLWCRIIEEQYE